jgi:hypothetical protein
VPLIAQGNHGGNHSRRYANAWIDLVSQLKNSVCPRLLTPRQFAAADDPDMASHERARTTNPFDRTRERLTQDEVDGIRL